MEEIALGYVHVANESMSRPIRALTEVNQSKYFFNIKINDSFQGKGFDLRDHVLACFGGAGGQHACAVCLKYGYNNIHRNISFRLRVLWA
jgi:5-oxoprolinase (ATP-hydrolysing)